MKPQSINVRLLFPIGLLFLLSNILHQSQIYEYSNSRFLYVLLGAVIALPLYFLVGRAASVCGEGGLFDSLAALYGRFVSILFAALFAFAACFIGAGFLRTYAELISLISLRQTPLFFLCLPVSAAAICLVLKGPMALGRWAHFMMPVVFILLGLGFALSMKDADFNNLRPFMYGEGGQLLPRSAQTMLTSFSQATLLFVPAAACTDREKAHHSMMKILGAGALILSLSALQNILVLGAEKAKTSYFTAFTTFSLIDVSDLFQRMEILIFILLLVAVICNIALCFHVSVEAVCHVSHGKWRKTIGIAIFLLINSIASLLRPRIMELFRSIGDTWWYFAIFHVLLPLAAAALLLIGTRRKRRGAVPETSS